MAIDEARALDSYERVGLVTRKPIVRVRKHEWGGVANDIEERAPAYVADTVPPEGQLQTREF